MSAYYVPYEIFPITLHRKGCFQKLFAVVGYVLCFALNSVIYSVPFFAVD
jgi:hypothetical protein